MSNVPKSKLQKNKKFICKRLISKTYLALKVTKHKDTTRKNIENVKNQKYINHGCGSF